MDEYKLNLLGNLLAQFCGECQEKDACDCVCEQCALNEGHEFVQSKRPSIVAANARPADAENATESKRNESALYRCPKCGAESFCATAHVTQDWELDAYGDFVECVNECVETTHHPDESDIWDCRICGYSGEGRFFRVIDTK